MRSISLTTFLSCPIVPRMSLRTRKVDRISQAARKVLEMGEKLEELERKSFEEEDYSEVPPDDIVAYNELRSCADLFRMHEQGILDLQPEFQRDLVWSPADQTRFIDSLTKQLPIPSMCFAFDHKRQRWIVIDGLQRINTVVKFLKGGDWRLSRLEDIDAALVGQHVSALKDPMSPKHSYYSRVENLTIPTTVLRCDLEKRQHLEYLFTIFHRLNTGGMKLNNQEIRNCIYGGLLNKLLKELDQHPNWRRLNRMKPNESYRFTKQELILRFLAFEESFEHYTGHLAKFLNDYMHKNRNPAGQFLDDKRELFISTVDVVYQHVFQSKPPSRIPTTILEAVLVGVGRQPHRNAPNVITSLPRKYEELHQHPDFSEVSLAEGLAKRLRVIERLRTAIRIFS